MRKASAASRPFRVSLVSDGDDSRALLAEALDLYSDEPDVYGKVVTRTVAVVPGVTRRTEWVVLYRRKT